MPAIAPHSTATTDSPWDGPAAEANLKNDADASYYKGEYAWYDANGDPDKKGTYKFPHHMVGSSGTVGSANVKACVSIIGVLNGGRGGASIPEGDRDGVYAHAAKHLRDAGQTPAELKSQGEYLVAIAESRKVDERERRFLVSEDLRIQEFYKRGSTSARISGHAAVFNKTADIGYFMERVAPGAFTRAIKEDDVRALWNHDANYPLARQRPGNPDGKNTLSLSQDDQGLYCEFDPPDTQMGRDIVESMKRGDVTQMSFGFSVRGQQITRDDDGNITRTLTDVKLYDVSPVTYPAYTDTDVAARHIKRHLEFLRPGPEDIANPEEQERMLRYLMAATELARII